MDDRKPAGGFYLFSEEYAAVVEASKKKLAFLRQNPRSCLIACGVLLADTAADLLENTTASKLVMGMTFCIALPLAVMAGSGVVCRFYFL